MIINFISFEEYYNMLPFNYYNPNIILTEEGYIEEDCIKGENNAER